MMIDPRAYIQDGKNDITKDFPSTWKEFRQYDSLSRALQEYLYLVNYYDVPLHYKKLYESVYIKLVEQTPQISDNDYVLPKIKEYNDFSGDFGEISNGLLLEACFQFAIFFLCRDLIKISGYPDMPLNLNAETLENVFLHNDTRTPQTSNILFNRYENAIGDSFDPEKENAYAECFYPICSNNDFKNNIANCTKKDVEKQIEIVRAIKKEFLDTLNGIAISLYKCITNNTEEFFNLNTQVYASGDGGETIGFMGIKNLGCFLFPYKNEAVIDNDNQITKDNIVHLYVWGFDFWKKSNIDVYIGITHWRFWGNKFVYNGLRPQRAYSITTPFSYSKIINESDSTQENDEDVIRDGYITINSSMNMTFDRNTNDLSFEKEFKKGKMNITLESALNNEQDEFFLIANIIDKKEIQVESQTTLLLFNLFDDDKFELKENTSIFYNKLNFLEKMKNFIIAKSPIIRTTLEGRYIGNYDYITVFVDTDYIPSLLSEKKERAFSQRGDKNVRYSEAHIQLDEDNNEIIIKIWSTTSPVWSRLDEHIKSPNLNEMGVPIEDIVLDLLKQYTNEYRIEVDTKEIPSYNQPLAMLRSMGVLEAIAKKLYSIERTDFMKNKMTEMLSSVFAEDKSGVARKNANADYQLKENQKISYAKYKSFKWYKDSEDYNLYDHSINFDTTNN